MAEQIKPKLKLKENPSFCKLVIPENVEEKIRHLCSIINDVEWSGVLFYRPEGSLDDGTFVATCVDIFVMDIGNTTFTSYTESPDIIGYQVAHRELLDEGVQEALIHSHNNMSAFFSGTDSNTLLQEGTERNHFLSLIVNNAGNYVARVTRKVTQKSYIEATTKYVESSSYHTFKDIEVPLKDNEERVEDTKEEVVEQWVEYFNLTIEKSTAEDKFDEINKRLRELKTTKIVKPSFQSYKTPEKPKDKKWWEEPVKSKDYNPFQSYKGYSSYDDYKDHRTPKYNDYNYYGDVPSWDWDKPSTLKTSSEDDKKLAHNMLVQLVTGSVLINTEKIDLEKWVSQMDVVYKKRFGDNKKDIESWVESMLDSLMVLDFDVSEESIKELATITGEEVDLVDPQLVIIYLMFEELSKITVKSDVKNIIEDIFDSYLQ